MKAPEGIRTTMTKPLMDQNLQLLGARSRDIFRLIVDACLRDGEPMASRNLSRLLPKSLSPATVRNVMSDIEQLGLLVGERLVAPQFQVFAKVRLGAHACRVEPADRHRAFHLLAVLLVLGALAGNLPTDVDLMLGVRVHPGAGLDADIRHEIAHGEMRPCRDSLEILATAFR